MRVGIVGFAGVGKTTIFNTLTGLSADTGFGGKRKVNTGTIDVPDERIDKLTEMIGPRKVTYAKLTFTDVPGGAEGSSALDGPTLEEIRSVEALAHVVRAFESAAFSKSSNPLAEVRAFQDELKLADQLTLERRLDKLKKDHEKELEKKVLERCLAHIESDQPLRTLELSEQDQLLVAGFRFLSQKPCLTVLNVAEDGLLSPETAEVIAGIEAMGLSAFPLSAQLEEEIAELDAEEQLAFLADLGLESTARNRFIRSAYAALEVISYLTQGHQEVRAWTIPRGTNAKRAARAIHTDLERGFIRAEVIPFQTFIDLGSEAACKEAGKSRLEGKDYIVQDGDIILIRANV